jgi:hypothetical protein
MAPLLVLGIIGASMAILEIIEKPGVTAAERYKKSKEAASRFFIKALDFEAENGKLKDVIRKVPLKPGGSATAYYQVKSGKALNFVAVYENGDIAIKAADKNDWDWYKTPDSLNRLYAYFRENFNNSTKGVEELRLKIQDLAGVVKPAIEIPGKITDLRK